MDWKETLKEKLVEKYGIKEYIARQKVNSDFAKMFIEIVEDEIGFIEKLAKQKFEQEKNEFKQLRKLYIDADNKLVDREFAVKRYENIIKQFEQCETPELRDRLRAYKIFKEDARPESNENNSVYIAGLASILSGVPVWGQKGK